MNLYSNLEGQARGDAVHVDFIGVAALRLEEKLVLPLLGKFHHLVLDARAVAWPDAFDDARVKRRFIEIRADDFVRRLVRVGDPAANLAGVEGTVAPLIQRMQVILSAHERVGKVAEKRWGLVTVLWLTGGKVDALGQKSARCAGLEALHLEAQFAQAVAECRDRVAETPAGLVSQTHVKQTTHECAGRNDHCRALETQAKICFHALNSIPADHEARHIPLLHIETRLALEQRLHAKLVGFLVALCPGSTDARAFCGVQHPELNACRVGVQAHRPAEGVDLADHVALCQPADRGVTGHLANRIGILG
jgi:hypothetical protein